MLSHPPQRRRAGKKIVGHKIEQKRKVTIQEVFNDSPIHRRHAPFFSSGIVALAVVLAQTPYYAGKTITIVAGTKAGDVYDLYARHFAQFLPKHIPGNPNIIVQNMAGAGSMIAANFVYNVASPDGLTIGAIFPALYFDQVVGRAR